LFGLVFAVAAAAFPQSASVWFNRADLHKFTPGDAAIPVMQALLAEGGGRPGHDTLLLHFALGKAFMDIGDSDRAFAHLHAGNRMKRETIQYDPATTTAWLARVAAVFSPALLARLGGQGAPGEMPVFVLGMPRSGTTLVEQILASHPAISGAGELAHIQNIAGGMAGFPEAAGQLNAGELRGLGQTYLDQVAGLAHGRRYLVDKMPVNFVYAGLIRLILPEARLIHCRRDPVDTCLSCYTKLFSAEQPFSYDLGELGRFYGDYRRLMAHWRDCLPATHFLEVDYEALIADVEGETRRMLAFLGLEWDERCRNFHQTSRTVRTASLNQVRRPVYASSAGRWRGHARHLGPLLEALGVAASEQTIC